MHQGCSPTQSIQPAALMASQAYGLVRSGAPHWMFVVDSSFRGGEVGKVRE